MTTAGVLVIDAREHRTQAQNREAARERLTELLRAAVETPEIAPQNAPDRGLARAAHRRKEAEERRQAAARPNQR